MASWPRAWTATPPMIQRLENTPDVPDRVGERSAAEQVEGLDDDEEVERGGAGLVEGGAVGLLPFEEPPGAADEQGGDQQRSG